PRSRSSMRTRATIASAGVIGGLSLSLGLAGCGSLPAPLGGSDGAVREVHLAASPRPGMRLSYRVRTVATVSGAGVRSLPESQKSASVSQRYVVEVTAVENDSFDV